MLSVGFTLPEDGDSPIVYDQLDRPMYKLLWGESSPCKSTHRDALRLFMSLANVNVLLALICDGECTEACADADNVTAIMGELEQHPAYIPRLGR